MEVKVQPRIHMLGRFNVNFGNQAEQAVLPRRKAAALLAILASPVGKEWSRQELADLLWGQCGEPAARNNLRQSLFVIRKHMAEFSGLLMTPDGIALDRASVLTDVQEFEAKSEGDSVEDWEGAVELFAGDFLEGLDIRECKFEDWRACEAERLSDVCLSVCERLMSSYLDQHRHSDVIRIANQSLRLDPFHEIAHETLVVAQAAQGRMDHARRLYERYAKLVSTELGIAPQKTLGDLLSKGQKYRPVPSGSGTDFGPRAAGTSISDTAIAIVLPFESAGKKTALLADALAANLVGELGAILPLPVLGHGASSHSSEGDLSPNEMATSLGARYSVQGGIRSWGGYWRVDFRVIDVATRCQLLSSSHQLKSDNPFGACDSFAGKIAAETATVIELREQKRMLIDNVEPVDAWERCCLGMALLEQLNHNSVILAQEYFREALEIAPNSARVLAGLSAAVRQEGVCLVGRSREETFSESLELALRAHALDRNDPFVNWSLGESNHRTERFTEALEPFQQALRAVPRNPVVCGSLGNLLSFMGMPEKGLALIRYSLKYTDGCLPPMARSYLQMGDYEKALAWSKKAVATHPNNSWAYVLLGSTLGHLGKKGEAYHALLDCEATHRGRVEAEFTIAPTQYVNPHDHDHVLAGIKKAGWRQ